MNMLKHVLLNRTIWGILVAALAPALAQHGIEIDQQGIVNDIASAVALAVAVSGHVQMHQQVDNAKVALSATGVDAAHAVSTGEVRAG